MSECDCDDCCGFRSGPQGIRGFQGPTEIGMQGDQGFQSEAIIYGFQGLQGIMGPAVQGPSGFDGYQGLETFGERGEVGLQGSDGIGNTGSTGLSGFDGVQGYPWVGLNGPQGFPGNKGPSGIAGTIGTNNVRGPQGIPYPAIIINPLFQTATDVSIPANIQTQFSALTLPIRSTVIDFLTVSITSTSACTGYINNGSFVYQFTIDSAKTIVIPFQFTSSVQYLPSTYVSWYMSADQPVRVTYTRYMFLYY